MQAPGHPVSRRRYSTCDPLKHAGFAICAACGERHYPDSATWLEDDLLLVHFPPGCHGWEEVVRLVKPSDLEHPPRRTVT